MAHNCLFCGKPIKLVPSASARAKKYGGKPSDYAAIFTMHADCVIQSRNERINKLLEKET